MLRLLVILCIAYFVFVTVRNMLRAIVNDPNAPPPPVPPRREPPVTIRAPKRDVEDARWIDIEK